jgi:hypothetical protein
MRFDFIPSAGFGEGGRGAQAGSERIAASGSHRELRLLATATVIDASRIFPMRLTAIEQMYWTAPVFAVESQARA